MRLKLEEYELGITLGVGTVGTVYKAVEKATGRVVAIKVLQRSVSEDKLVRARFRREIAILQRVRHPHIIEFYGSGESDGLLFYVMELVEGGSIKDLLRQSDHLSWAEVASIAKQVCSALQHAHNNGIIHRDLKPGNLFLTNDGKVKLGDFGIARDTYDADLTLDGFTVGTHAYMAPEQIVGEEAITGKADLYSLGCVLFEMLTGHTPFEGSNFSQLFEKHLRQPAPKVRDYMGDCPVELESVIAKLLEKRPEDRPFNARTVQGIMMKLLEEADTRKSVSNSAASASAVNSLSPGSAQTSSDSKHAGKGDKEGANAKDVGAAEAHADYGQRRLERRLSQRASMARELNWRPVMLLLLLVVAVIVLAMIFRSK
jgi:serine/threonine protein kinase